MSPRVLLAALHVTVPSAQRWLSINEHRWLPVTWCPRSIRSWPTGLRARTASAATQISRPNDCGGAAHEGILSSFGRRVALTEAPVPPFDWGGVPRVTLGESDARRPLAQDVGAMGASSGCRIARRIRRPLACGNPVAAPKP